MSNLDRFSRIMAHLVMLLFQTSVKMKLLCLQVIQDMLNKAIDVSCVEVQGFRFEFSFMAHSTHVR